MMEVLAPITETVQLWRWQVSPTTAKLIKLGAAIPLLGLAGWLIQNFLQLRGFVNLLASRIDLACLGACVFSMVYLLTIGVQNRLAWRITMGVLIVVIAVGFDWLIPKPTVAQTTVGLSSPAPKQSCDAMSDSRTKLTLCPDKLVLHDLYMTDFFANNVPGENTSAWRYGFKAKSNRTGATTEVEYSVINQTQRGSELLMFYIPYTSETYTVCSSLSGVYQQALDGDLGGGVETSKVPGDSEQTTSKNLVFSKMIYVYHETYLSLEQTIAVRDAFKKHGVTVILRSSDYLADKIKEDKLKQLTLTRPSPLPT